jgi:iron-sulfur cluster assembly accessory protein
MKKEITKDMTIGEVIDAYPITAEILLDKGVHCIGCGARFMETIEQGLKGHGMPAKKIEKVVKELNEAAKIIIHITPKAAKKLKEVMKKQKKEKYCLRVQAVKVKSGYNYGLDFEKTKKKGDMAIKAHGLTLLISAKSLPKVRGAKIDYIDRPEPGFSIKGPRGR